jgi:ABC-type multidrug transport system fused ATPase/permease subunit
MSFVAGLTQYSQSRVSTQRMLTFLELEELEPYVDKDLGPDGAAVEMTHVHMGWVEPAAAPAAATPGASAVKGVEKNNSDAGTGATVGGGYAKVPTKDGADAAEGGSGEVELTAVTATSSAEEALVKPDSGKESTEVNRSIHTLVDVSFSIKKGELVAVVGSVGSGKSSLLNGLLGEMLLQSGQVRVHGSIAYCDQRPWILNDTVQGNVLFGQPYDEARFDAALYAANMEDDVTVLPGGINTQIGKSVKCTEVFYCREMAVDDVL